MGYQVIKQPDGRLAIWSTYTDSWAAADCTSDEVVTFFADKAEADARRDVERIVTYVLADDARAVYHQFAMTFEEADEDARPGEKYADLPAVPDEPVAVPLDPVLAVKRALVAAYRELAEWLEGGASDTVLRMAAAVEALDESNDYCCPLCEETTCDEGCALAEARGMWQNRAR